MPLVTDFEDIPSPTPCVVTGEALKDGLKGGLVEVDHHGNVVDLPLHEIATVEASGVSESELELLGDLSGNMSLDVRDDGLVVAPSG